jgi:hypothetical protein
MNRHGAVDIESCDAGWRRLGWSGRITAPEDRATLERYPYVFGDYPGGSGRIYRDPRASLASSARSPRPISDERYHGPERRHMDKPYVGINRRTV